MSRMPRLVEATRVNAAAVHRLPATGCRECARPTVPPRTAWNPRSTWGSRIGRSWSRDSDRRRGLEPRDRALLYRRHGLPMGRPLGRPCETVGQLSDYRVPGLGRLEVITCISSPVSARNTPRVDVVVEALARIHRTAESSHEMLD